MINRKLVFVYCITFVSNVFAAGGSGVPLLDANVDTSKQNSLQRGARTYFNYCAGCHSLKYMRYNRLARDLGIEESLVKTNLMFATDKIVDPINVSMGSAEAESWFGVTPPDLSVTSRVRGANWLFSFLNGFYLDESRPTGVNNIYYPQTAMPHVLWELQGHRNLMDNKTNEGKHSNDSVSFSTIVDGRLSSDEYQSLTRDLVSFLVYVGEPARLVRYKLGFWVIAFLCVLFVFAYLTKKEIWKDVH